MTLVNVETNPSVLVLDVGGRPLDWMHWAVAVCLEVRGQVAWQAGSGTIAVHGGINQQSGLRSVVEVSTIIAVRNARANYQATAAPSLTNMALFRRDRLTCMYCGEQYVPAHLTRDHILPSSKGGRDVWTNVTTACRPCNSRKDDRTPEQAGMELLALPYEPSPVEALILANRRVLADQHDFLMRHVPRSRRDLYTQVN
jgi:hypothetical protein